MASFCEKLSKYCCTNQYLNTNSAARGTNPQRLITTTTVLSAERLSTLQLIVLIHSYRSHQHCSRQQQAAAFSDINCDEADDKPTVRYLPGSKHIKSETSWEHSGVFSSERARYFPRGLVEKMLKLKGE